MYGAQKPHPSSSHEQQQEQEARTQLGEDVRPGRPAAPGRVRLRQRRDRNRGTYSKFGIKFCSEWNQNRICIAIKFNTNKLLFS